MSRFLISWKTPATVLAAVAVLFTVAAMGPEKAGAPVVVRTDDAAVTVHLVFPNDGHAPVALHYVEHLAWQNAVGPERAADRHSNAWTSNVAVGYWLTGPPKDLPELLTTLAGVFDPIDLPRDFALQERDIVLREYEFRMTDNPDAQAALALDAILYAGNAIAVSVIGTPEEINALDYDEARVLHAATHVPEKARLVVIGDVSARRVRQALRSSGWPEPGTARNEIAPPRFDLAAPGASTLRFPEPSAAPRLVWRRVVTLDAPVGFDLLEARTALLRDILDTTLPGGLAGPLRFDAAIARSFDVKVRPIDEANIEIGFTAAPDAGVTLLDLQGAFEATLTSIAASGIPEDTHSRVLNRFEGFWPNWSDTRKTARWMADYSLDRVSTLRSPLPERDLKRLHRDLTPDTTNALLRQLAGEGRTAVAFIGPRDSFE